MYNYTTSITAKNIKQHTYMYHSSNLCEQNLECTSRLTVVSRTAKQSRARDTTVCYIHERSILIERSPNAYCKKLPYEKTTHGTKKTYNHLVSKTNTK